ncbi:MAG: deoxynucleoside kinase [Actinobacteria bacterium]|nr:deoxynucleoside kinase [Actinomycetota bacterium]
MKNNNVKNNNLKANKGILIVIEGIDSSGKETQVKMVFEQLLKKNLKVMKLEFPDYKSDSSALIKMYLNGKFGEDPITVNPYAASLFFASDRFASYKTSWESFYNSSGIIIADRYVSSNMIYQAAKIKDDIERQKFMEWIYDLEFNKLNLPKPDIVIFLSMPVQFCLKLNSKRLNKITGLKDKDIHEKNIKYLKKTYDVAIKAARKYQWNIVNCIKNDFIKPIEEINKEILEIIEKKLNGELKF